MRKFRFYICIFYLIESHALHVFHNVTWQQYRRHQFRSENPRRFLAVTPKGPCVHRIRDICDAHIRAFVHNIDTHAHSAVHPFQSFPHTHIKGGNALIEKATPFSASLRFGVTHRKHKFRCPSVPFLWRIKGEKGKNLSGGCVD